METGSNVDEGASLSNFKRGEIVRNLKSEIYVSRLERDPIIQIQPLELEKKQMNTNTRERIGAMKDLTNVSGHI